MKKTFLLLNLIFSFLIYAQHQQQIVQEFYEFVKSESGEYPLKYSENSFLQFHNQNENVANKKSTKIQLLDSVITLKRDGMHSFFLDADKILDVFTYDKSGKQIGASEKSYKNDTFLASVNLNFKYKDENITSISFCVESDSTNCAYKGEYSYENDKLKESKFFMINETLDDWELNSRTKIKYDGSKIENVAIFFTDTNGNEKQTYNYGYNFEKNKISIVENDIDRNHSYSHSIVFNDEKKIKEIQKPHVLTKEPLKVLFFYNEYGNLEKSETYFFSQSNEEWVYYIEELFSYNDRLQISSHVETIFYHNKEQKIEILYKEGYVTEITKQEKENTLDEYSNTEKDTYSYDENGNLLNHIGFEWSDDNNLWEKVEKDVFDFNKEYLMKDDVLFAEYNTTFGHLLIPLFYNYIFEPYYVDNWLSVKRNYSERIPVWNMLTNHNEYIYDAENKEWEEKSAKTYYYSENDFNLTNETKPYIGVYPNPCSHYFRIDLANVPNNTKIQMYNSNGEKVMDRSLASVENIDVNHLQSGLYYFKLIVDDNALESIGKLMVN